MLKGQEEEEEDFFDLYLFAVVLGRRHERPKNYVKAKIIASLSSSSSSHDDDYKKCLRSPPPNLLASESSPRRRRRRNRSTRSYRYAKKRERASLKRFDDVSLSLSLVVGDGIFSFPLSGLDHFFSLCC